MRVAAENLQKVLVHETGKAGAGMAEPPRHHVMPKEFQSLKIVAERMKVYKIPLNFTSWMGP